MTDGTSRSEAREAIRQALLTWKAEGHQDPTIPVYADVDGDGIPDVYGLDARGRLELRPDVPVMDTVAVPNSEVGP